MTVNCVILSWPPHAACARLKTLQRNVLALFLAAAGACAARPLATPDDFWRWRTAADPRISPDGAWVIYVEGWRDRARNASFSNLWMVSSDGRRRRPFTQGDVRDRSPRWSPDSSRIAWLSEHDGKIEILVRRADSLPGSSVTTISAGPRPLALAWSPDGDSLAFTAEFPPRSPAPAWAPPAIAGLIEPRPRPTAQIFVVPAAGGAPRMLSAAPLDFTGEPAWMPNGQSLVCTERGGEIFSLPLTGAPRQLTRNSDGPRVSRHPVPSPDGTRIAYTAAAVGPQYYAVRRLRVMNADGSRDRQLAGALGRDVRHPQWSNDSRTIYCTADDRGATHVYAARNDGSIRQVTNRPERLHGFSLADNGRAVTVRSSATEGSAVFTFDTATPAGGWTLIDVNQQLLAEREWGVVEEMPFESAGRSMQAWLIKPPRFDPARRYPLLLDISDAPQRMHGGAFDLRAQIFSAAGFVVLHVNPRGTPGYGEEFGNLLETQIPADPANDLQAAVDRALTKSYIDPGRVIVSGGPLALWLVTHKSHFAAAVIHGLSQSTMPFVPISANFRTPALVIAAPHDPAAEMIFSSLQHTRIDSSLLHLPPGTTSNAVEMSSTLAWLAR